MSILANETPVKVNQGFGVFTTGVIIGNEMRQSRQGKRRYYQVRITGGRDCFKRQAKIGVVINVHASNLTVNQALVVQ